MVCFVSRALDGHSVDWFQYVLCLHLSRGWGALMAPWKFLLILEIKVKDGDGALALFHSPNHYPYLPHSQPHIHGFPFVFFTSKTHFNLILTRTFRHAMSSLLCNYKMTSHSSNSWLLPLPFQLKMPFALDIKIKQLVISEIASCTANN